nr:immunoglobulin light chain junction region [Macaca mulatta]
DYYCYSTYNSGSHWLF